MIAITVILDAKGRPAADPSIIIEGIPEPIHNAVRDALEEPLKRHNPKRDGDGRDLKESLRRAARRAADAAWGKKPVTRVEIVHL
jgi:ribonuclease J